MRATIYLVSGMLAGSSASATAEGLAPPSIEQLTPGAASLLPGKGPLPRRERPVVATVGAELYGGDSFGADALASLRLAETLGIGAGLRGAGDGGVLLRMDVLGLAINHWSFLGYVDYVVDGNWSFGGAMLVPLRSDDYLRLSVIGNADGGVSFGLGMEHDVW